MTTWTLTLTAAAISVGSVHTLAPDHWMPFALLARAEHWSARRTAAVTALCGLGHVTVSVALGLMAAGFGLEVVDRLGRRLEGVAGLVLIAFGSIYGLWALHRTVRSGWHDHDAPGLLHWHVHHDSDHGVAHAAGLAPRAGHVHAHPRRLTAWALFLLFSADPCVAVIPLIFAAAPLGVSSTLTVVAAYETATIATMVLLTLPARHAAARIRGAWADRYGDALAGGLIAVVGMVAVRLGL